MAEYMVVYQPEMPQSWRLETWYGTVDEFDTQGAAIAEYESRAGPDDTLRVQGTDYQFRRY